MSKYLDRILEIVEAIDEADKADLSQAVALTSLRIGDEWAIGLDLMEAISVGVGPREDITTSEYSKLMNGDAIAKFDLLEGI